MSGLYPDRHTPGQMVPIPSRTAPVPPLDDDGLGGTLDDLVGFHAGIDQILDGIRLLALDRLTAKQTTNVLAALTGDSDGVSVVTAIGQLVERLTSTTNPALSHIEDEVAKEVAVLGERYRYELTEYGPQGHIAEAVARIHGI
ncbi:hypothetical protein ACFWG5_34490 [Streptomyces hydrogenans]|uniref:hypothetical protein n=1 Tax=Streptomyces TaxID=1883 RepID=UPI003637B226